MTESTDDEGKVEWLNEGTKASYPLVMPKLVVVMMKTMKMIDRLGFT